MAIENTYLLGKNITLGCGFDLQAKAPLDSRQTVPTFEGLRALIIGDAAYEGMIVYDEGTKKTYQAQKCESYSVEVDGKTKTYDIAFREFGINESELKELIASETTAAMEFKGATATLPESPAKGDMWKVTASFEVAGETTKVGDSIVYNGEEWFRIPSGDDIEDTWRIVKVEGTSLGGVADGKELNLTAGDKLDVVIDAETGAVVYKHEAIDAPTATPVGEDEQTRTYIASIETDGHGHIIGYKTATENVEDTNTTYEFEGLPVGEDEEAPSSVYFQVTSSEEGATAEVIYIDAYTRNEADGKFVEKVAGKQLSTEDFTTALLNKLNGIADEATKVENVGNGKIKINDQEVTVYVHPDKHVVDDINGFESAVAAKVESYGYATATEVTNQDAVVLAEAQKYADSAKDAAIEYASAKADKSVVEAMYTNGQIDTAVQGAKDYADEQVEALATGAVQANADAIGNINDLNVASDGGEVSATNIIEALNILDDSKVGLGQAQELYNLAVTNSNEYTDLLASDVAGQIAEVNTALSGKASQSDLEGAITRIEANETAVSTNAGDIETLFGMFQWGEF